MERWLTLLEEEAASGLSDLHLCEGRPPIARRQGRLSALTAPDDSPDALALDQLIRRLLGDAAADLVQAGDEADGAATLPSGHRLRLHAYRSAAGACLAVRLIGDHVPGLDEIGAPDGLSPLLDRKHGLILVTGATGSGKSTTLAAMLRSIAERRGCHILTIEDPIEFQHQARRAADGGISLINQREIGRDTTSYAAALRSALRADPDVLMVGEMRDLDTIRLALSAAETGHLVLSTLHTNSAAKSIDRLIDAFPGPEQGMVRAQLSTTLLGVVAQTLLPKADGGRIGAFELLVATDAIRNLIRENELHQIPNMQQMGAKFGMTTMQGEVQRLLASGLIEMEAAQSLIGTLQDQDEGRRSALDPMAGAMLSTRSY